MPALNDWPNNATTDPETIQDWFAKGNSNLGLAMGPWQGGDTYLVCIDLDRHDPAADGVAAWQQLVAEHGDMGAPFVADTATGGMHLLYQSAVPLTNERGELPPGIDVRGVGGQIMVQPSVHPKTGTSPTWRPGTDWDNTKPGAIPQWLLELIQAKPDTAAVPDYVRPPRQSDDTLPGDEYNRTHSWHQTLTAEGWTPIEGNRWLRPGKTTGHDEHSAVLHPDAGEHGVLVVFSTNAPRQLLLSKFATTTGGHYKLTSPWAFHVAMHYGGDFVAAARSVGLQMRQAAASSPSQATDPSQPAGPDSLQIAPLAAPGHSWVLREISELIGVPHEPRVPRLLRYDNSDRGLFYGDAHNLVAAGSNIGKSWLQAIVCLQEIRQGNHVVIIDYEMTMRDWFTRLQKLGATDTELTLVHYCAPDEALGYSMYGHREKTQAVTMLTDELQRISELGNLSWVVVDGVTNAMTQNELKLVDNQDTALFWDLLPQRIVTTTGAGVGLNDHVAKGATSDTATPLGAMTKIGKTSGSAFVLRAASHMSSYPAPRDGVVVMRCLKDRHGEVGQPGQELAQVVMSPNERTGLISYQVLPYHSDAVSMITAEREKVLQAIKELNSQNIRATANKIGNAAGISNKTTLKQHLQALSAQGHAKDLGTQSHGDWHSVATSDDLDGFAF